MKLISVIVATRNRPDKISNCLHSILANSFSDFEIIVVDQSDDGKTREFVQGISNPLIRYFGMKKKGLSKAKNFGIKKAKGKIITFIDDDAIVNKNWLKNVYQGFQENKNILVVCGQILPWKPRNHLRLYCSGVTGFRKKRIFATPCKHKGSFFYGSALSIKKNAFKKIGFFKEWLGVGSLGVATEDEEFIYRLLKDGNRVLLNPQVVVYHDKWLTGKEFRRQLARYACGFFAAFGYYAFQGDNTAQNYLLVFLKKRLQEWKREIKFCLKDFHPKYLFRLLLIDIPLEFYYYIKGTLVALYFILQNLS